MKNLISVVATVSTLALSKRVDIELTKRHSNETRPFGEHKPMLGLDQILLNCKYKLSG